MSEFDFIEKTITIKSPADGLPHAASDNVAWVERTVSATVCEGIGLGYYPACLNGETIYLVAHLASGKAVSQPVFSARTSEQAECWIHRLDQDIDWLADFPRLRPMRTPEMLMGYAVVGQLSYSEHSCSICHEFSIDLKELTDMQLCAKCYVPPRDDTGGEMDLATVLYRFMLALAAIVRCAADHAEVDLHIPPHFEIIPGNVEGEAIVTTGVHDVFVSTDGAGRLVPGFTWTHGDVPYGSLDEGEERQQPVRPTIVCLCGSTRFSAAFHEANLRETLAGRIVLSIGCDTRSDADLALAGHAIDKAALDQLHLRKIDLADEVLILNVGGYVGDSTAREIAYARRLGKRIRWLEQAG